MLYTIIHNSCLY